MPVKDLSLVHQLISDLFHWPTSRDEWLQYTLSDEQVEFFRVNGFISGIKMLDEHLQVTLCGSIAVGRNYHARKE